MMMLKREVDYEPISPVKTTPFSISPHPSPNTPARSPIGLGLPGSRHAAKSKSLSNVVSGTPSSRASSVVSPAKRVGSRLGSAATVPLIESAREAPVPVPQRSATLQSPGGRGPSAAKDGVPKKTTEDKKALLGTMLGNVDHLVDAVSKAGVWGLS
jgi:hypothetical protein